MRPVFDYMDYQAYLRNYYEEKKRETTFFSYRYMGRRLGLDPGFLVKVLQGKMHLSVKAASAVSKLCKFTNSESEYFECLVRFARSSSPEENKIYFEKLMEIRGVDAQIVAVRQYDFYKKWYHSAIRSLIGFYPFAGNYEELAKKLAPPITQEQAEESIKLLLELGFIEKDSDGKYSLTENIITTGDSWKSAMISAYQEETIKLAGEAIDRFSKEVRDISTMTVSARVKDLETIKELARKFRQSVLQLCSEHTGEVVYQVNLQVFPLSDTEVGKC
ncbi:TIGR02147 family protein [Chitinispirillales bacterium ANBcel5]|uniref:TIGR02147 family protein n=1 Tax=Cellulosispirillum alkaliphilum TaxID=3039283 RepID=UPI002A5814FC|nr:TIGR02147 family protein [Chitinispirillales bacterium ANBcel5]